MSQPSLLEEGLYLRRPNFHFPRCQRSHASIYSDIMSAFMSANPPTAKQIQDCEFTIINTFCPLLIHTLLPAVVTKKKGYELTETGGMTIRKYEEPPFKLTKKLTVSSGA